MKKYFKNSFLLPVFLFAAQILAAQSMELSLQDALQMAAKGNRNLQIQLLQSRKVAEVLKETKSYLFPSVSANGAYSIYSERPVIFLRNETASPKLDDVKFGGRFAFDGTLAADYPLLNPALQSGIRRAGIDLEIEKQKVKSTEEQLALDISQLYLSIQMNGEQGKLLVQSLRRNEQALKDSRALFLQGKSLKTDTLSNYIAVQHLHASLSALENNSYILMLQLKQLLGLEENASFVLTDNFLHQPYDEHAFESSAGFSIALNNRADIRVQTLHIEKEKEKLHAVRASFRPQVWATAQYQLQNQADNFRVGSYVFPTTSFVGLRMSIPIYSGNRQQYKSLQSRIAIDQNELALNEMKNSIQNELVSVQARLQEAITQWQITEQIVNAAEINYRMMNDRYRHGLSNRLELTDAELSLTRAKLDNLLAIYNIRISELQVKKAMGLLQLK